MLTECDKNKQKKFNLLRDRQTQQIIGHRLQGVLYKILLNFIEDTL